METEEATKWYEGNSEKYKLYKTRLEHIYSRNRYGEYIHVRQRHASIRVRIPLVGAEYKSMEKNFRIDEFDSLDEAINEARRYRQRHSGFVLKDREEYKLKVSKGIMKKKRFRRPDAHGNLGTMIMRENSFYFEVHGVVDNKQKVSTFPVNNSDLDNIQALKLVKREAIRYAESIIEEKGTLIK